MKRTNSTDKNIRLTRRIVIMLAAVITAIAVAVTCALCIGAPTRIASDSAGQGEVTTSATKALTSAGSYSYTASGALSNGDIITMAYCGGQYTIALPQGTYKLEVWGGQGGGQTNTAYGGKGGYTYGEITFTSATTLYVNPGGAGAFNTTATVYNGGGQCTTAHNGGSGGGASHIATASGQLSALSGNTNSILVVAGGGGGIGCSCAYTSYAPGSGGGGNNAGTAAPAGHHSSNRGGGYGGTLSGGGAGGSSESAGGANAGSFGKGGNQTTGGGNSGGGAG
ncbi:MAG: hypothetical protein K2I75_02455, partial [Clostridiales bacterium]|nr:hypothetical protein [Clostridiales bacterium]